MLLLIEVIKITDLIDWIKKYLIALSLLIIEIGVSIIKKMNIKRFISIPIQIIIQELEDRGKTTVKTYNGIIIKFMRCTRKKVSYSWIMNPKA